MTNTPTRDSKADLLDAAQAAIRDREEKAAEAAVAARLVPRERRIGILVLVAVAGSALLILQPTWLAGPKAPPPETPPVAAASLRLTLLRQRDYILDFHRARGRLPATLAEAGDSMPGVQYERTSDGGFRLTASAGDSVIVLRSGDSTATFLGRSIGIIRNRGQQ
jgi:hypothetical protein